MKRFDPTAAVMVRRFRYNPLTPRGTPHASGETWLNHVPETVAACARSWRLTIGEPFDALTWNVVLPVAREDGTTAVLKIGPPGIATERESAALRLFGGQGAARVHDADVDRGALLLEQLIPGTPLSEVEDDVSATSIAAGVMRRLYRPLPERHSFPSVATLALDLDALRPTPGGRAGPIPRRLVDEAQVLFADLIASQGEVLLLHGDLHHDNILRSQRDGWLAIDPKGVAGERAYEVGALLRNPASLLRQPAPERILSRRIDQLSSELDLNRQRVRGWAMAQAVLSVAWSVQDTGEPWAQGLAFAELLARLS